MKSLFFITVTLLASNAFCQSIDCKRLHQEILKVIETKGVARGEAKITQMLDDKAIGGQRWNDLTQQYLAAAQMVDDQIQPYMSQFESNCLK